MQHEIPLSACLVQLLDLYFLAEISDDNLLAGGITLVHNALGGPSGPPFDL